MAQTALLEDARVGAQSSPLRIGGSDALPTVGPGADSGLASAAGVNAIHKHVNERVPAGSFQDELVAIYLTG